MARPANEGLSYFPLDTMLDDNFELIEAKYGLQGFAVIIKLYQKIYKENGYYLEWDERTQLLFSKRLNVDISVVNAIITDAIEYKMFDRQLFTIGILTSRGIQKRFLEAARRRKVVPLYKDLMLIDLDVYISGVNASKNPQQFILNVYIGTHTNTNTNTNTNTEIEKPFISELPEIKPIEPISPQPSYRKSTLDARLAVIAESWKLHADLPRYVCKISATMKADMITAIDAVLQAYTDAEIITAIDNYAAARNTIEPKYQYQSFHNFIANPGAIAKYQEAVPVKKEPSKWVWPHIECCGEIIQQYRPFCLKCGKEFDAAGNPK